jgi:hypothetical protein
VASTKKNWNIMAASELFNRYIWLVDLIYRTGGITREEINRRWAHCTQYNLDNEREIPERTFHRHKDAIKELFGIDIICDRSAGLVYRIENQEDIERGGVRSWLLNTFAVNNLINESHRMKRRILFEQIPSGQRFLTTIIEAMRDNLTISFVHQSFYAEHPSTVELEPWCVKVYRQRWYVLGRRVGDGKERLYGLDRITQVDTTNHSFKLPKHFDADSYFKDVIGIIISGEEDVETVKIKLGNGQQKYLRSLPLHHSQVETVIDENESMFTFRVRPTFDFIQELLKYGAALEVVQPQWLRDEMRRTIKAMSERYETAD